MADSNDSSLPMNTILHLITIRLNSSNYLLWKNQLIPLLNYQQLLGHVDGSVPSPPPSILVDDKPTLNPALAEWVSTDQRAVILLQASLTEEAFSEIVGLSTAHEIWVALEATYGNSSVERAQNLRDQLRHLTKGSSTVSEFGRKFKSVCDQLAVSVPRLVKGWRKSTKPIGFFAVSVPRLRIFPPPSVPPGLVLGFATCWLGPKVMKFFSNPFTATPLPRSLFLPAPLPPRVRMVVGVGVVARFVVVAVVDAGRLIVNFVAKMATTRTNALNLHLLRPLHPCVMLISPKLF